MFEAKFFIWMQLCEKNNHFFSRHVGFGITEKIFFILFLCSLQFENLEKNSYRKVSSTMHWMFVPCCSCLFGLVLFLLTASCRGTVIGVCNCSIGQFDVLCGSTMQEPTVRIIPIFPLSFAQGRIERGFWKNFSKTLFTFFQALSVPEGSKNIF